MVKLQQIMRKLSLLLFTEMSFKITRKKRVQRAHACTTGASHFTAKAQTFIKTRRENKRGGATSKEESAPESQTCPPALRPVSVPVAVAVAAQPAGVRGHLPQLRWPRPAPLVLLRSAVGLLRVPLPVLLLWPAPVLPAVPRLVPVPVPAGAPPGSLAVPLGRAVSVLGVTVWGAGSALFAVRPVRL